MINKGVLSIVKLIGLLFLPVWFWMYYSSLNVTWSIFNIELPKNDVIELCFAEKQNKLTENKKLLNDSNKSNIVVEQNQKEKDSGQSIALASNKNLADENKTKRDRLITQDVSQRCRQESATTIAQNVETINSHEGNISTTQEMVGKNSSDQNLSIVQNNGIKKKAKPPEDTVDYSTKSRIFILGDSMGQGVAYGLSQLKIKNIRFKSIAKSSTTTHYWVEYDGLEEKILAFEPTVILIILGSNECVYTDAKTKIRILKLYQRLSKLNIKMVWVTPPMKKSIKFCGIVREYYGDNVYDSRTLNVPRGADKIHPTGSGYITWTKDILKSIEI